MWSVSTAMKCPLCLLSQAVVAVPWTLSEPQALPCEPSSTDLQAELLRTPGVWWSFPALRAGSQRHRHAHSDVHRSARTQSSDPSIG